MLSEYVMTPNNCREAFDVLALVHRTRRHRRLHAKKGTGTVTRTDTFRTSSVFSNQGAALNRLSVIAGPYSEPAVAITAYMKSPPPAIEMFFKKPIISVCLA